MQLTLEKKLATTKHSFYAVNVARSIGGDVTPEQVDEVVKLLREGMYLVHGVKSNKDYQSVDSHGVERKTPEGGQASFWNSGSPTFGSGTSSEMSTFNSAFFHYGHSVDFQDPHKSYMTLALTTQV